MQFEFDPNLFPDDEPPVSGTPRPVEPNAVPAPQARTGGGEDQWLEAAAAEDAGPQGIPGADPGRRVVAESELAKSWEGGVGAADFLGLDEELRAPATRRGNVRPAPAATPAPAAHALPQPPPAPRSTPEPAPFTGAEENLFTEGGGQSWLMARNEAPLHVPGTPSEELLVTEESAAPVGSGSIGATYVEARRSFSGRRLALLGAGAFVFALGGVVLFRGAPPAAPERAASGPRNSAPLTPPPRPLPGSTPLRDPDAPSEPLPTGRRTPLSRAAAPRPSDEQLLAELVELASGAQQPPRLAQDDAASGALTAGPFGAQAPAPQPTAFAFAPALTPIGAPTPFDFAPSAAAECADDEEAAPVPTSRFASGTALVAADVMPEVIAVDTTTAGEGESTAILTGQVPDPTRARRSAEFDPAAVALLPGVAERLARATPEDLRNVWPGTEPPLAEIGRAERLLTPRVGRVRLVLESDELFEGQLYAVGQERVWIDTDIGRIAFPGSDVADVQRLGVQQRIPPGGATGFEDVSGLTKVAVRLPGGTIYGYLVQREGDSVTLLQEGGGRITVQSAQVEPVGKRRTTIVQLADAQ